jgi:hypothetical protein
MLFNKKRNSAKEVSEIKGNWDTIGLELLHQKYKHDFTPSEKESIKNMLKDGPPPLQYRQKVSNLIKFFIVMAN